MQAMADLLNAIEKGQEWQSDITSARAVFLLKDPAHPTKADKYRVLLMLSYVYWRWAALRLTQLAPWIQN